MHLITFFLLILLHTISKIGTYGLLFDLSTFIKIYCIHYVSILKSEFNLIYIITSTFSSILNILLQPYKKIADLIFHDLSQKRQREMLKKEMS